jgi:hypothetical protein
MLLHTSSDIARQHRDQAVAHAAEARLARSARTDRTERTERHPVRAVARRLAALVARTGAADPAAAGIAPVTPCPRPAPTPDAATAAASGAGSGRRVA